MKTLLAALMALALALANTPAQNQTNAPSAIAQRATADQPAFAQGFGGASPSTNRVLDLDGKGSYVELLPNIFNDLDGLGMNLTAKNSENSKKSNRSSLRSLHCNSSNSSSATRISARGLSQAAGSSNSPVCRCARVAQAFSLSVSPNRPIVASRGDF